MNGHQQLQSKPNGSPTQLGSVSAKFIAFDFKDVRKGDSLQGFVTLELPSHLVIKDCAYHCREDGRRWIGLPGKPFTKQDGTTSYVNILDFSSKEAKNKFQRMALEAVDELLAQGGEA
jgi:hypothetical protein